jgi:MoxR-like ATPase
VLDAADVIGLQAMARDVVAAEPVLRYAAALARATRPDTAGASDLVKRYVRWGAGPRAGQALVLGAKARALLQGRAHVSFDDVRALALPVLRHRILLNFQAQSEKVTTDTLITRLLGAIATPRSAL